MLTHISPKLCKLFSIQIQNIKRHITSNYTHKHQNHFLKVDCLSQSYQISHVSQRLMPAPPPPQWGIPIVISKTFSWIDDADLCNWAHICSWAPFHFNISHQTIWFRENLKNSAYVPFSYNWVLICDDDGIIDFYISALCAPFLSWHELRKNISVPPLPQGDNNLLTELNPMVWIFHVAKWTLRNSVGCSTKYDVVWT